MPSGCATPSEPRPGTRRLLAAAALAGPPGAAVAVLAGGSARADGGAALAVLLVVAPVLEETVFRGGLQAWLARQPIGRRHVVAGLDGAVLIASLAFGALHLLRGGPLLALAVLPPALVLGLVYRRCGTLGAPIALHAWYNACLLGATALLSR